MLWREIFTKSNEHIWLCFFGDTFFGALFLGHFFWDTCFQDTFWHFFGTLCLYQAVPDCTWLGISKNNSLFIIGAFEMFLEFLKISRIFEFRMNMNSVLLWWQFLLKRIWKIFIWLKIFFWKDSPSWKSSSSWNPH